MIAATGYQSAFFTFGIGQGVIVCLLAFFLRKPSRVMRAKQKQLNLPQTKIDFTPPQVLRSPILRVRCRRHHLTRRANQRQQFRVRTH
jgi:OFA family oxalate/formate antiporter-like MFS transporter